MSQHPISLQSACWNCDHWRRIPQGEFGICIRKNISLVDFQESLFSESFQCLAFLASLQETESLYRSALRSSVRAFWSGIFDHGEFMDRFTSDVRRGIIRAWEQGSAECGVLPSEWSLVEINALQAFVAGQVSQVGIFALAIESNTKARGGKLRPLFRRAELWINRYPQARIQAAAMACGDIKKIWVLGPTEKHCKSCGGFENRVYRNSVWHANGALPRRFSLVCGGFNCKCRLEDTDRRVTPGRFPRGLLK